MTTTTRWALATTLSIMAASACRADQLYLKNGQVKVGKLVKKDADFIDFRIIMQGGKMKMVQRYPAADVVKIEYDDETETTRPQRKRTGITKDNAEPRTTAKSTRKIEDKPAFLKQALAKIEDDKLDAAVSDLTRLVYACQDDEDELAKLSELCEDEAGKSLAELLAANRLKAALDKSRGRLGKLTVTKIERDPMVRELRAAIDDHRGKRVGGTTIDDQIEAPDKYQADRKDAKVFAKHVAQTLDLVGELKRLEPAKAKSSKRRRLGKTGRRVGERDPDGRGLDDRGPDGDDPRKTDQAARSPDRTDRDDRDGRAQDRDREARRDRDRTGPDRDSRDRAEPDNRAARGTRAPRGRNADDLGTLHKQLQALYRAVQRVARGRALPRREGPGEDDQQFSDDQRDAGRDQQRGRRRGTDDLDDRGRDRRFRDQRDSRDPRDDRPPDDLERDDRNQERRR